MMPTLLELVISIICAIIVALIVIPLHLIFAPIAKKNNEYINKNACVDRVEEPE